MRVEGNRQMYYPEQACTQGGWMTLQRLQLNLKITISESLSISDVIYPSTVDQIRKDTVRANDSYSDRDCIHNPLLKYTGPSYDLN